jgi:ferric-dicitrate binding protein FerR (iron transport regulator)
MTDKRRSSTRSKTHPSRRRANRRRLIALVLIVVFAAVLLWLGSYLYDYQIEFYEPRDEERQEVR